MREIIPAVGHWDLGLLGVLGEQREFEISMKPQTTAGIRKRFSEGERLVKGHTYKKIQLNEYNTSLVSVSFVWV